MNTTYVTTKDMVKHHDFLVADKHEVLGLVVDGKLVGHLECHDDGDSELFIDFIEVEEPFRKMGYATLLLHQLHQIYPNMQAFTGESTASAVPFWKSTGVLFHPDALEDYAVENVATLSEEGELYPFSYSLSTEYVPYWSH